MIEKSPRRPAVHIKPKRPRILPPIKKEMPKLKTQATTKLEKHSIRPIEFNIDYNLPKSQLNQTSRTKLNSRFYQTASRVKLNSYENCQCLTLNKKETSEFCGSPNCKNNENFAKKVGEFPTRSPKKLLSLSTDGFEFGISYITNNIQPHQSFRVRSQSPVSLLKVMKPHFMIFNY